MMPMMRITLDEMLRPSFSQSEYQAFRGAAPELIRAERENMSLPELCRSLVMTDINTQDSDGKTLLMHVLSGDYRKIFDAASIDEGTYLDNPYIEKIIRESFGTGVRYEIVKLLVERGADVMAMDSGGRTALMYAAEALCGRDTLNLLMDCGVDVNAADDKGCTALMYALKKACHVFAGTIGTLIERGADLGIEDENGRTAIFFADEDPMQYLLEHGADPNHTDRFGHTCMVYQDRITSIKTLMNYGADINIQDEHGRTPLILKLSQKYSPRHRWRIWEERYTSIALVKAALVKAGADVNIQDENGSTALMYAVGCETSGRIGEEVKRLMIVRTLLEHGADVNIRNSEGLTALAAAQKHNDPELIGLLRKYGAEV